MKKWFFAGSQNTARRLDELDARLWRRDDIASLLQAGQKSSAIKIYREDTGASLSDARAAVERMEQQIQLSGMSEPQPSGVQEEVVVSGTCTLAREVDMKAVQAEVENLLSQDKKIAAIKVYREQTGTGLREAKEAVERIADALQGRSPGSLQQADTTMQSEVNRESSVSEIENLLRQDRKIEAIKRYRMLTGAGLREAKEAVDRIDVDLRGNVPPVFRAPTPGSQEVAPGLNRDAPNEEVRRHLRAGHKIAAIKAYREQTGLPLKDAKDTIDLLERSLRSNPGL